MKFFRIVKKVETKLYVVYKKFILNIKTRYIKSKRWKKAYYDNENLKKVGVALLISGKANFTTSYPAHWWGRYSHPGVGEMAEHTTHNTRQMKPQWFISHIYSQSRGVDRAQHTRPLGLAFGNRVNKQWLWRLALQCEEKEGVFPGSCGRMCLDLSNFTDGQGTESCYLGISRNCSWSPR